MGVKKRSVSKGTKKKPALDRVTLTGMSRLLAFAGGKEILVVGPSGAGKTKFSEYLREGILGQENTREMTYHISQSTTFMIREGGVTLKVRRAVDTPGQTGPINHANLVGQRKPHALIIVLDCNAEAHTVMRWLHLFCDRLDTVMRKGFFAQKKLHGILVLLNKRDKIRKKQFNELRQDVETVLSRYLSVCLGAARVQAIPIMECISVQTKRGTALIDDVIDQLMERLAKKEP